MDVTITNRFHGTSCTVRVKKLGESGSILTRSQIKKVRKALCGISGCLCFGFQLEARAKPTQWADHVRVNSTTSKDDRGFFMSLYIQ